MKIKAKCPGCGKEHVALVPEGMTSKLDWNCDCGSIWGRLLIYPTWVVIFSQGIRLMNELDFRIACHEFASAYEVFQKHTAEVLLLESGLSEKAVDAILEARLDREEVARLIGRLLGCERNIQSPSVKARNRGYHYGSVPEKSEAENLASSVLQRMEEQVVLFAGKHLKEVEDRYELRSENHPLPYVPKEVQHRYDTYEGVQDLKYYWENRITFLAE